MDLVSAKTRKEAIMQLYRKNRTIVLLLFISMLCMAIIACSTNYEEELNGVWELDIVKTWEGMSKSQRSGLKDPQDMPKLFVAVDVKNAKVQILEEFYNLTIKNKSDNIIYASLSLNFDSKPARFDIGIKLNDAKSFTATIDKIDSEDRNIKRLEGSELYFKCVSTDPTSYKSFMNK